jgi:hypothetical protein
VTVSSPGNDETVDGVVRGIEPGRVALLCSLPIGVGEAVSLTFSLTAELGTTTTEGPVPGRVTHLRLDDVVMIEVVSSSPRARG